MSLTDSGLVVRPGAVLVGDGIEIKTAVPRLSAIAQATVIPNNPEVRVTFNKEGEVINAEFVQGTGSANWDGPIQASLYKWRATGKRFQEHSGPLVLKLTILIID